MPRYYPSLQRFAPFRPLDWRWQRATDLVRRGRYFSRQRDDAETGLAVSYLRELARCRTDQHTERLALDHPEVHSARLLHEKGGVAAVEVQARLLARQTAAEVANYIPLSAEAVSTYEQLFF